MLDVAGERVPFHRAKLPRNAVDDERLHPTQHDPELLVGVAVKRDRRACFELDQVDHGAMTEEGTTLDALGERERLDIVEADELDIHGEQYLIVANPSEIAMPPKGES